MRGAAPLNSIKFCFDQHSWGTTTPQRYLYSEIHQRLDHTRDDKLEKNVLIEYGLLGVGKWRQMDMLGCRGILDCGWERAQSTPDRHADRQRRVAPRARVISASVVQEGRGLGSERI